MRENRTCGSEGGEAQSLPYPYPGHQLPKLCTRLATALDRNSSVRWQIVPLAWIISPTKIQPH